MRGLIGRQREREALEDAFHSGRPEFVAVYGRRRVGKTFLIRSVFERDFTFFFTAAPQARKAEQLAAFAAALAEYGGGEPPLLADWTAAFTVLRRLVEKANRKRKVVFIDELPWLDTRGSGFLPALQSFWNGWASVQDDVMLVVCGSAASWIVKKIFRDRGGLHNRVTRRILLRPFTLAETKEFLEPSGLPVDTLSLLETYMTVGGIPYYLDLLSPKESLTQNIERLCFAPGGALRGEFNDLYPSLFRDPQRHLRVVRALAKKRVGLTREEIQQATRIPEGGGLTAVLEELELSGFIHRYEPYARKIRGSLFRLGDFFTLFHLAFIEGSRDNDPAYWQKTTQSQAYRTWRGYAFEQVCLSHLDQLRRALGIEAVIATAASWRSSSVKPGAQVDLLLDRADRVVTLCEMKFSESP
ncbi:MAG: ATP-binding protein, partial [Propionibacteriaceae bacterium]|nr:ATP-binding protein [Propionibacteriaceae bacterium]